MKRWRAFLFCAAGIAAITPLAAAGQTIPEPQTIPATPPASDAPSVIGPTYGANDPCTSLGAIVSRPSQTNSVCTVRPNHVLIETGYQNTSADGASTSVQYPQTFARIGTVVPALEIDLGLPMYERTHAAGATVTGTTDVGAGLKYVLGYTSRFNYGASVFFTTPTGSNGISAGSPTQAYALNYGYTLGPVWSLAGTFSFDSLSDGTQRYSSVVPSLVLTAGLPNATGLFVEAAQFTHAQGPLSATRTQFLGGVTRGLSARSQIDLEIGGSPTSQTGRYHFLGFGASYYL